MQPIKPLLNLVEEKCHSILYLSRPLTTDISTSTTKIMMDSTRLQPRQPSAQTTISPASPGQKLTSTSGNSFLILDTLGAGGQGAVYRAFSEKHNKVVAIKLPVASGNNDINHLLTAEAANLAGLKHPNIVKLIEHGTLTDDRPFLVMEYVKAERLDCLIQRRGKLDQKQAAAICLQIADAIEHAHQHDIVHRDLKPGNILVANIDGKDVVTVIDFGISSIGTDPIQCKGNNIYGSVLYLSPEQLTNDEISNRSDIYQLGLIFFECLLGCLPFQPNWDDAINYRLYGQAFSGNALKQLTSTTSAILRRALARNPKHRQLSMCEFALQLKELTRADGHGFVAPLLQAA
jgi:serine/threonine-protein kinase